MLSEGFDGVHLDLEPISTGDEGYLALLRQVHAATQQQGRLLSVAAAQVEPLGLLHLLGHYWTNAYLHDVAASVDEVAIMAYDSGMPARGLYAGYVRKETSLALGAVPAGVTLLIGLPAFHSSGDFVHFNSAETVGAALHGVRMGISPSPPRRPFGVALYVDFAATAQDWADYLTDWVRPAVR